MFSRFCILKHEYDCDSLNSLHFNVHIIYVLSYELYCIIYVTHEHVLLIVNKSISFFHIVTSLTFCLKFNKFNLITPSQGLQNVDLQSKGPNSF